MCSLPFRHTVVQIPCTPPGQRTGSTPILVWPSESPPCLASGGPSEPRGAPFPTCALEKRSSCPGDTRGTAARSSPWALETFPRAPSAWNTKRLWELDGDDHWIGGTICHSASMTLMKIQGSLKFPSVPPIGKRRLHGSEHSRSRFPDTSRMIYWAVWIIHMYRGEKNWMSFV